MSTITVHDIQGFSTYSNRVRIPNGHLLEVAGQMKVPTHTTSTRPPSELGTFGFNTETEELEVYITIGGTNQWYAITKAAPDGSSQDKAAASGYQLIQDYPNISAGLYWIKSSQMPTALEMYVDTAEDGGGYDFYYTTNGPSISYVNSTNAGSSVGLNLVFPRSKYHWRAMSRAATYFDSGNHNSYFTSMYGIHKTGGGGNFTGCIMRSSQYGGNNCGSWQVPDNGKWWARDNTHSEPNGDYTGYGLLSMYGGNRNANNLNALSNIGFNDGGAYASGNRYLLSTNAKP
jgi:hypothetical protein